MDSGFQADGRMAALPDVSGVSSELLLDLTFWVWITSERQLSGGWAISKAKGKIGRFVSDSQEAGVCSAELRNLDFKVTTTSILNNAFYSSLYGKFYGFCWLISPIQIKGFFFS